jgi:stage III sporulation protein AF
MAMISFWLKKVILVVLLAVFLDLLLPNGTMQRYVKMVMGFVIIVTLLSPISALYSRSFSLGDLESSLSKKGAQNISMEQILQEGKSLQKEQQNLTVDEWKNKIRTSIKDQIEKQFTVTVTDVSLAIAEAQGENRMPEIQEVKLLLRARANADSVSAVKPVDPVHITVGEGGQDSQKSQMTPEMAEWNQQILSEISADLQVPKSKIQIQWEPA